MENHTYCDAFKIPRCIQSLQGSWIIVTLMLAVICLYKVQSWVSKSMSVIAYLRIDFIQKQQILILLVT